MYSEPGNASQRNRTLYVVNLDLPELRELTTLLRRSSNNLNQLTRLAHLGEIKVIDLTKLLETYEKLLVVIAKECEKS